MWQLDFWEKHVPLLIIEYIESRRAASFHLPPPFKKVQHQQNVEQLLHCSEHIKIHLT